MLRSVRVPCVLMRGGTSRGPFFLATDLPGNAAERDQLLISALGAGHELQIDGIGGGSPLTSKVAIVGPSTRPDADVDYLFAQVKVAECAVDTSPNCGNMLSAVAPFAIEQGLVRARHGRTTVRIHNVNTGKLIAATVQTPDGGVTYEGTTRIDGVPGGAAPIHLTFVDAAGSKTGHLLPTSAALDVVENVPVTCIDAATPLVIMRAEDLGKTGLEQPGELDADCPFMTQLEAIRCAAARRMGLPLGLVIPKPVLIAPALHGGTLCARYFMPHACHRALAVTGAVALATACAIPGSVAHTLVGEVPPAAVAIEHPSGKLELELAWAEGAEAPTVSVVRTARRIFEGAVFARVPEAGMPLAAA
ncbi:MAG TPA: 4-oxalomesaconate tautomerase [Bradyrhizobium sp.]|uniref:4-oxalomesaconate tautomerase n=1 Tax=Bradyrhizobium sp. TaxID=376 RepID=UPI002CCA19D4|nr:4-oxalomesaconate tautomerase [Bradyrhizobium sp.]HLZ05485.1 4-oxalomesaconate tautomerase [Bradyrhizobium sp.]